MPCGLLYLTLSIDSLKSKGRLVYILSLPFIPVLNAISAAPDQTPRSAASDLGLHCLLMSLLYDVRHKWHQANL